MSKQRPNMVIQRLMTSAVLTAGLFIFATGLAGAQERCKPANEVPANVSSEESREIAQCWLRLAQAGAKDLRSAYLVGQNLSGMDFSNANLTWANLFAVISDNAQFTAATLFAANLVYADIKGGKFAGADLRNADLSNSRLNDSDFTNADLRGANLTGADHRDTIRTRARVSPLTRGINVTEWEYRGGIVEACKTAEQLTQEKADGDESYQQQRCWLDQLKSGTLNLSGAYLRSATLGNNCSESSLVDLSGRNFTRADLSSANLKCTNLSYSNLNWADLRGAELWGADLSGASFAQANLSNARITGANTFGANFNNAKWDKGLRIVRLRLKSMVCTLSDDEGPGNDADISLVRITVRDSTEPNWMTFYDWKAQRQSEEVTVHKGYSWIVNREFLFPGNSYNGQTTFEINVRLVESDYSMGMYLVGGGADDERAENTEKFTINLNSDRGDLVNYIFPISNSDVAFDLYFEAEVLGG